ncbi:DNA alkylation repair protein [Paraburkholderia sp. Ac-20347]|uniref:DNA alkylation repair protein n=1 Tax=Paraburkholderia sp. Ac-20347 TaxID=2703892 RepID=UPI00197E4629|nr:DNA alkylation repair protein [Paraburkholderia sp. Ac-20347]MBN3811322.1 DNA alkylation repair protein [Paraburkholderia sp. Ac-20347]
MTRLTPERLAALNGGTEATRNLAECLAIDQALLAQSAIPGVGLKQALPRILAAHSEVANKGISYQIRAIGMAIAEELRRSKRVAIAGVTERLQFHASDTVRSWAVFALTCADETRSLEDRLHSVRPFAADSHFGVREWAWMAARPYISGDIESAVALLQIWTTSTDANIRRFAVESTRPRGVWSEHIARLKAEPGIALPLLEPLKADHARYVQDSLANWLNDASKTQPDWVVALCARWATSEDPSTDRIIKRALRTLQKKSDLAARAARRS